jgi:phosphate:Na+ symporter
MSANEQGKRLAGAHLVFNLVTGLIAILFIYQLMDAVEYISDAVGISPEDYALKLAVFHTIFNLIGVLVMVPFVGHLVRFFESFIKTKKQDIREPRYLSDAATEFPDTAVKAVRNETIHVYDNALTVISGGLGFSRNEMLSDEPIDDIIARQKIITDYDIDAAYERDIKVLYSAIIVFISKVGFSWQMEQSGSLHWLREANQNIAEAVKDIKHLQRNLLRFINSDHQEIRSAYNQLRGRLVLIVREIEDLRREHPASVELLSFDALSMVVDDANAELNRELSELIRAGHITPEMGSSLLNDTSYAHDVSLNLIKVSQTLFVVPEVEKSDVEKSIELDDDEMDDVAHSGTA